MHIHVNVYISLKKWLEDFLMILNLTNIWYVIYKWSIVNDAQSKLWYVYNCVKHVLWSLCSYGFVMLCFNVLYLKECQMQNKYLHWISQVYIMALR